MSQRFLRDERNNMYKTLSRTVRNKGLLNYIYAGSNNWSNVGLNLVATRYASQSLPQLPVPKLEDTLKKYLRTVKPFLCPDEYQCTERIVEAFGCKDGIGTQLQEKLLAKAKISENWLQEWWLNVAYLDFRSPVVVFSSPGLIFPPATFKCEEDRLDFTACMISAAIDYKLQIDGDKIPVDMMGKNPLDMNQYKRIFGTCRIPGCKQDSLQFNPTSKHIIIIHKNHFFKTTVLGTKGEVLSIKQLVAQLKQILEEACEPAEHPIGILTSDNRDNWGRAYELLMKDSCNKKSVETIQKALFTMSLDGPMPKSQACNKRTVAAEQLIHGGGCAGNAGNRWYDKTIQFVVGVNGINGITYEHSPSEGQPIAVMTDYLVNYIKNDTGKQIPDAPFNTCPKKLEFNVECEVNTAIETAAQNINALAEDLDLDCVQFKLYGKEFIKSQKMSPDSFIQIALQYAFYRLHEEPGAHYESAATRQFIHGRTETIRSCSVESVAFAKVMLDSEMSDSVKVCALKEAVNGHKKYTIEALNGLGVDRHLLGLKLIALENNMPVPELYTDKGFVKSGHFRISTSQVATKCDGFMAYGPIVLDGYACCYNPRPNDINLAVAAHHCDAETSASDFRKAIECSLKDMHDLLVKYQQSKL